MNTHDDCIFCKIIDKQIKAEIVFENDSCIAFNDIRPKAKTHILVVPKKHISSLFDINASNVEVVNPLVLALNEIAKNLNLDGYRTIINTGKSGGQEVFHLHFHLLADSKLPRM